MTRAIPLSFKAACGRRSRLLVAGLTVAAVFPPGRAGPAPRAVQIEIRGFAFAPGHITVDAGDTVVWTNRDALPHTTTADSGAWSSPELAAGSRFLFVPKRAGRYAYHCAAHPVMRGLLTVRD